MQSTPLCSTSGPTPQASMNRLCSHRWRLAAPGGKVAATLGCTAKELYFTSGGTEGNNLAILGRGLRRGAAGGIRSSFRVLNTRAFKTRSARWEKPVCGVVEVNPGPDGRLAVDELVAAVDSRTALCCCMAVNNETGARQDIARLAAGVKAKNNRTAVHVDAVQAWLRMRINLKTWPGVDSLVVSGHKVHAPKGIGALYLRAGYHWTPPILGGGQGKRRAPRHRKHTLRDRPGPRRPKPAPGRFRPTTPQSAPSTRVCAPGWHPFPV